MGMRVPFQRDVVVVPCSVLLVPASGVGVLLLAAARAGATRVVEGLITRGVHIGFADWDHNTPLHIALEEGHEACACALVALGAVEHHLARNLRGMTPAHLALSAGLPSGHKRLMQSPGALAATRMHSECFGRTQCVMSGKTAIKCFPLIHNSAIGDLPAVLELCAAAKCSVPPLHLIDVTTPEGCSALGVAAENGHAHVIEALISENADVSRVVNMQGKRKCVG